MGPALIVISPRAIFFIAVYAISWYLFGLAATLIWVVIPVEVSAFAHAFFVSYRNERQRWRDIERDILREAAAIEQRQEDMRARKVWDGKLEEQRREIERLQFAKEERERRREEEIQQDIERNRNAKANGCTCGQQPPSLSRCPLQGHL